ncbi:hypothetical protein BXZ70DRAFT_550816 [Cristinia sonorae]|uniref:DUF7702 domain-containing protein n=1 Tax=Cristinia sonorae TaxID=1940300 RepID=A0A8K0XL56_9AGAR|nr:hypothetical protein BXZ70DRAFT_550816 [Cristinia sonorae]
MGLDARGDIAVVQLVIFIPFLAISTILVLRHGFNRRAGWLLLLIFSIIRIIGSAIHIASEQKSTPDVGLIATYITLEGAGLSPLLVATLGFLSTVAQQAFDSDTRFLQARRLLGLVGTVALALAIAGGSILGSADSQSSVNTGTTLRHVGVILFVVLFVGLVLMHGYLYLSFSRILTHRRKLLVGISMALPFLLIRVIYAVLAGFAPSGIPNGSQTDHNDLSKFSSQTGSWQIYLVMSVLMEIIVMVIYTTVGLSIRLQDDGVAGKPDYSNVNRSGSSDVELNRRERV